jgi:hypothetical protein
MHSQFFLILASRFDRSHDNLNGIDLVTILFTGRSLEIGKGCEKMTSSQSSFICYPSPHRTLAAPPLLSERTKKTQVEPRLCGIQSALVAEFDKSLFHFSNHIVAKMTLLDVMHGKLILHVENLL